MADMAKDVKLLVVFASTIVTFGATILIGIAVMNKFKEQTIVDNATADYVIAGITFMGSFTILLCLGGLGKVLIRMFRSA